LKDVRTKKESFLKPFIFLTPLKLNSDRKNDPFLKMHFKAIFQKDVFFEYHRKFAKPEFLGSIDKIRLASRLKEGKKGT